MSDGSPESFFVARGFGLRFDRDESGVVWASLASSGDGRLVAPRYGRGVDEAAAALSAVERWRVEQAD